MNKIRISFIIPVYNVESYIEDCVNSIVQQVVNGVEIILVDDGSTDSSGKLCDFFDDTYEFINVIHKTNGGLSSARNAGLSIAKGEYVAFVDSDDYIGIGSLNLILDWISQNNEDICFLNGYKVYFDKEKKDIIDVFPKREEIKGKTATEALETISGCEKFPGSACTKIYKYSFLKANKLCFPEDIKHGEDLFFNINCFAMAKTFDYLDIDYYYYRQARQGSITNSKNSSIVFGCLSKFVIDTIKIASSYPERRDSLYRFAAYEYAMLLHVYANLSRKEKKDKKHFFKDNMRLISFGKSKRLKLVGIFIKLFGISITSFFICIYMKVRL